MWLLTSVQGFAFNPPSIACVKGTYSLTVPTEMGLKDTVLVGGLFENIFGRNHRINLLTTHLA